MISLILMCMDHLQSTQTCSAVTMVSERGDVALKEASDCGSYNRNLSSAGRSRTITTQRSPCENQLCAVPPTAAVEIICTDAALEAHCGRRRTSCILAPLDTVRPSLAQNCLQAAQVCTNLMEHSFVLTAVRPLRRSLSDTATCLQLSQSSTHTDTR